MATLQEIRAKLKEQESKSGGSNSRTGGDNAIYPFWNLKEGEQATVRFLPDGDKENTFFWKERLMIKLPFAGIKGETDSRPVQVQVPCMEMYGESCNILSEVRGWFKDPKLEDLGRKYWKKRSYIFQGFVKDDPIGEENTPENPIRRFIIGPQIFQIIKGALMDPDMEDLPTDSVNGVDFRIIKTSKGGYADYSTSTWSRKSTPLTEEENKAIESNTLFNLSDFLPKKPSEVDVKVMKEMFEASVDGEAYDQDKFGSYFRPAGLSSRTGDPVTPKAETPAPAAEVKAQPVAETKQEAPKPTAESSGKAEDILAMIRARQQK
jgi:hypothetical protein|tara:strand:- start:714 stop:1676 length:963 start_codon:yes stop_codon:yes gene_type:complete